MLLVSLLLAAADPAPALQESFVQTSPIIRVAVTDFELLGVDRQRGRVVQLALLAEVRKLEGVTVIGTDEVRAMLQHEANKQLMGCSEESCLAEIADALGVDVLLVGTLARTESDSTFGLKRVSQKEAKVTHAFDRRFDVGNGEEFLVAIGPAVEKLFADVPLKSGVERGAAKEMALRLNPPPLPAWVFWSGAGTSAALIGGTIVVGVLNLNAAADLEAYKRGTVDLDVAEAKQADVNNLAYATYGLAGATIATGVATTVAAFFTDFWGYAEMNAEAAH